MVSLGSAAIAMAAKPPLPTSGRKIARGAVMIAIAARSLEDGATVVVGTGGFAGLLNEAALFDAIHPDLALEGVRIAQGMNA